MMYQHFNTQPLQPSTINTHLSADVDAVILHALAKRPQDRFGSIAAFAQAFYSAVQHIDTSTFGKPSSVPEVTSKPVFKTPLETPDRNEFRATLTISQSEARTGVSRRITLPGGRQVSVSVPAGAQDGQIIRFERLSELTTHEELAGTLILTLAIQHTEGTEFPSALGDTDRNVVVSNPIVVPAPASPPSLTENQKDDKPRVHSKRRTVLLIVLALLIVASSIVAFFVINNNQIATENSNSTATANSAFAYAATATSQAAGATATSQAADATATSQASNVTNNNPPPITSTTTGPFQVTSIDMTVNPISIAGLACGTNVSVTYTATIHVAPGSSAEPVQFTYTTDGGHTNNTRVVQFNAGQTSHQFQFPATGTLATNGAFPGAGQVTTTSPNSVSSQAVTPHGTCTPVTPSPTPTL